MDLAILQIVLWWTLKVLEAVGEAAKQAVEGMASLGVQVVGDVVDQMVSPFLLLTCATCLLSGCAAAMVFHAARGKKMGATHAIAS